MSRSNTHFSNEKVEINLLKKKLKTEEKKIMAAFTIQGQEGVFIDIQERMAAFEALQHNHNHNHNHNTTQHHLFFSRLYPSVWIK